MQGVGSAMEVLYERYRHQGLRLVVVSVQEREGSRAHPGWNPDDVVCDSEGELAKALGVDDLPAAFLWSWQGMLLVRKAHIEEVERAVKGELGRLRRGTLNKGIAPQIRDLLRAELSRTGKLDVLAGMDEENALAGIRRKSYEMQFSDEAVAVLVKGLRLTLC